MAKELAPLQPLTLPESVLPNSGSLALFILSAMSPPSTISSPIQEPHTPTPIQGNICKDLTVLG